MTFDPVGDSGAAIWLPLLSPRLPTAWGRRLATGRSKRLLRLLSSEGLTALECALQARPGETSLRFDIAQRIDRADQATALASRLPATPETAVLSRWAGSGLDREIPSLWLEFDFDHPTVGGDVPRPLICLRIADGLDADVLLDRIVPRLLDADVASGQRRTLGRLLAALPAGARPLYLFDLSPRRQGTLRLELVGLDATAAEHYLRTALPSETAQRAVGLLPWIADSDRPHVSFDIHVDGSIDDRIGFEMSYVRLPHRESRWALLFDRLVSAGLCAEAAKEALFAWPGQERPSSAGDAWPRDAAFTRGHLVRVLSHAKIVSAADRPLEAKGYVLFQYLPPRND
ncbi:MAG: hypothetical protein AAGE94_04150 [Acidobacteriota bacterium]